MSGSSKGSERHLLLARVARLYVESTTGRMRTRTRTRTRTKTSNSSISTEDIDAKQKETRLKERSLPLRSRHPSHKDGAKSRTPVLNYSNRRVKALAMRTAVVNGTRE